MWCAANNLVGAVCNRSIGAAVVASFALAGSAAAEPEVYFTSGAGDTGGGILLAHTQDYGTFETFCVEFRETLRTHEDLTYQISTGSRFNGTGTFDPLDERSAYLYTEFRNDGIRDLLGDQSLTRERIANAMQIALWDIESQGVDFSDHPDFALAAALIDAADDAVTSGAWSGLGKVRVMQNWLPGLVGTPEGAQQDTLILIPLPSGVGLAGLGLFGIAAVRRRRG